MIKFFKGVLFLDQWTSTQVFPAFFNQEKSYNAPITTVVTSKSVVNDIIAFLNAFRCMCTFQFNLNLFAAK